MKFIDLFCGIGGFRFGLERLGHECVFSSEIDEGARESYFKTFGDLPHGDIRKVHPFPDIPPHDILCAGFPCQPFSIAGRKQGRNDERGNLFNEILRIADAYHTEILLLENVKHILHIDNGNVIRHIKQELEERGYHTTIALLDSAHFGFATSRERVYIIATQSKSSFNIDKLRPGNYDFSHSYVVNHLESGVKRETINRPVGTWKNENFQKINFSIFGTHQKPRMFDTVKSVGYFLKGRQGERIYSVFGKAPTITKSHGKRSGFFLTDEGEKTVSCLTLNEWRSIMDFPEKLHLPEGNDGYSLLGNSVIPGMVEFVASAVLEEIDL